MTAPSTPSVNDRSALIAGGLVSLIVGIVLLIWPEATIKVLAVLLALNLLLLGAALLVSAVTEGTSGGAKVLGALLAVLALVAGVAVLSEPLRSVALMVVVVGAFWVVGGVIEVLTGLFGETRGPRWIPALSGAISMVFGIILLSWPGPTLAVLVWLIAIWSVAAGLTWLFRGWRTPRAGTV